MVHPTTPVFIGVFASMGAAFLSSNRGPRNCEIRVDSKYRDDPYTYDFSALEGKSYKVVDVDGTGWYYYYLSICGDYADNSDCSDYNPSDSGSDCALYQDSDGSCFGLASWDDNVVDSSVHVLDYDSNMEPTGIVFTFDNGSMDYCVQNRQMTYKMICGAEGAPVVKHVNGDPCQYEVEWPTEYACSNHTAPGSGSGSGSGSGEDINVSLKLENQWGSCGSQLPGMIPMLTLRSNDPKLGYLMLSGTVNEDIPLSETTLVGMADIQISQADSEDDPWISFSYSGGCVDGPNWANMPCECSIKPSYAQDDYSVIFICDVEGPTGVKAICNGQYSMTKIPPSWLLESRSDKKSQIEELRAHRPQPRW